MKSGFPSLKTTLALAWTQIHEPFLVSSLKTVKPLSPVFITEFNREEPSSLICYQTFGSKSKVVERPERTPDVVVGAVHHVRGVDEVVAGAFHTQLDFIVTQNHFASREE